MSDGMLVVDGEIKPSRQYWPDDETPSPGWAHLQLQLVMSEPSSGAATSRPQTNDVEAVAEAWFERVLSQATSHLYLGFADEADNEAVLAVEGFLVRSAFEGGEIRDGPVPDDGLSFGSWWGVSEPGEVAALLAVSVFIHDRLWSNHHEATVEIARGYLRAVDPPLEFEDGLFDGLDGEDALELLAEVTLYDWLDRVTNLAAAAIPEDMRGWMHVEHSNGGLQLAGPSGWTPVRLSS